MTKSNNILNCIYVSKNLILDRIIGIKYIAVPKSSMTLGITNASTLIHDVNDSVTTTLDAIRIR